MNFKEKDKPDTYSTILRKRSLKESLFVKPKNSSFSEKVSVAIAYAMAVAFVFGTLALFYTLFTTSSNAVQRLSEPPKAVERPSVMFVPTGSGGSSQK